VIGTSKCGIIGGQGPININIVSITTYHFHKLYWKCCEKPCISNMLALF